MTTRYKLTLEYDGTPFVGWQTQTVGTSLQQVLGQAIEKFCGERVAVHGAGRTDARVHARGQVAHIDLDKHTSGDIICGALNFHLRPHPVAVLHAEAVAPDFHARFSAIGRRYRYRIVNRRAALALDADRAWHVVYPLDVQRMHKAARALIGHHDFSSFRAALCQAKSPIRTLERLDVTRHGEDIFFDVEARSFLHNQVRIMVGTLKLVGEGKWPPGQVAEALAACRREAAGPTAPPEGLCLEEVRYGAVSARQYQSGAQHFEQVVDHEDGDTE